ncbi:hypothetical protein [Amycolatopsis suaedae]|uniref:Uncharacterized protein n=1 Tax=Amycolatopsis suaedae TaxID=2510978 RepID=A0A4Q7JB73_9PSEU|nr:hypothetical protein [Amycolatopsis suaedae]RZQ65061.1 hypothetical protein EWH70_03935 [Amycolatopsis suaedae]
MRTHLATTTRRALTATVLAALASGGMLLTSGTASATTVLPKDCATAVTGQIGDEVAVTGASVKELVRRGAREAGTLALYDVAANDIAKVAQLKVGTVPNAASGSVTGEAIGAAVTKALKDAGSWGLGLNREKTLASIHNKVAGSCGFTAYAGNYTPPTTTQPGGSAGQQPGGGTPTTPGTVPLGTGTLPVPPRDYSNIPAAVPGLALPPGARYPAGSPLPGQHSPEFGILGQEQPVQPAGNNAGNGTSLAAAEQPGTVQLPMLLAVVALAGVAAALVRTWVLRRVS